jgi:hypothetical protein
MTTNLNTHLKGSGSAAHSTCKSLIASRTMVIKKWDVFDAALSRDPTHRRNKHSFSEPTHHVIAKWEKNFSSVDTLFTPLCKDDKIMRIGPETQVSSHSDRGRCEAASLCFESSPVLLICQCIINNNCEL